MQTSLNLGRWDGWATNPVRTELPGLVFRNCGKANFSAICIELWRRRLQRIFIDICIRLLTCIVFSTSYSIVSDLVLSIWIVTGRKSALFSIIFYSFIYLYFFCSSQFLQSSALAIFSCHSPCTFPFRRISKVDTFCYEFAKNWTSIMRTFFREKNSFFTCSISFTFMSKFSSIHDIELNIVQ